MIHYRNLLFRTLATTVCGFALTTGAVAQDTPDDGRQDQDGATVGVAGDSDDGVKEIVVTATRRAEALSDVPVSVTAFSEETIDRIGAREVDDITRLTPGVQFQRKTFGASNQSSIAIRGISSSVGAGTVGVYLDDTPIQVRNIYYTSTNAYPRLFDLERVEILRGPQGTLFGAGSMGGTVRFISPAPDLDEVKLYARGEVATTLYGDPSYEAGVSASAPIISDRLAVRVSGWHRRDGGWIDRVDLYQPNTVLESDANHSSATTGRIAVAFAPTETLTITPSFMYQDQRSNNGGTYWLSLSDPEEGIYRNASSLPSSGKDRFGIAALAINWELGGVDLVTNTSYFKRNSDFFPDYTGTVSSTITGSALPPLQGYTAKGSWLDDQENFTQEVRLQSADSDSRASWVVGAFYSHAKQRAQQFIDGEQFGDLLSAVFGVPVTVEDVFGSGPVRDNLVYVSDDHTTDEQLAAFGQIDYEIVDRLTLTAGVRVSNTKFTFPSETEGPYLGNTSVSGSTKQTPITPKFGLSYETQRGGLLYATASKGFRVGGAQRPAPVTCADDLEDLGIDQIPQAYGSDSVWSYEVGAKDSFFGRKLQVEASAYQLDWKNIQRSVGLIGCNLTYIDNLGSARSRGFDLALTARPVPPLTIGLAVAYTDAKYTEDVPATPPLFIVREGDTLGQRPWTVYLNVQYDFDIGNVEAYVRGDYSYESRNKAERPVDRIGFDPLVPRPPATHQVAVRAGGKVGDLDISVFVENLLNSKTNFGLYRDTVTSPVFYGGSFRPRTAGLTVTYRR